MDRERLECDQRPRATLKTVAGPGTIDVAIADVLRGFPEVAAAWLFGSEARGDAGPRSDVDIALLFRDRGIELDGNDRLVATIAARLERVAPGREIDVVLIARQPPMFVHRVLAEGRLAYDGMPERRIDFESDATSRYLDFLPTYRIAAGAAIDGMRQWLEQRKRPPSSGSARRFPLLLAALAASPAPDQHSPS
jgi:uncharacterized protein